MERKYPITISNAPGAQIEFLLTHQSLKLMNLAILLFLSSNNILYGYICFLNLCSEQIFLFTVTLPKRMHYKLLHDKGPVYILTFINQIFVNITWRIFSTNKLIIMINEEMSCFWRKI